MSNNEPRIVSIQHLCRPSGAVSMAQAVESVSVDGPVICPLARHWISPRRWGQSRVKGGIEYRDLRNRWQNLLDGSNTFKAGRVMEWRQFAQFTDCALHLRSD